MADLKVYGLGTPTPRMGLFAQPWVQLLTAEWELVLGAWLLSGIALRWSWLVALVTFVTFAGVSGYLGWVGVASCGCLGTIQTNPWWAFGADALAVTLLVTSRPQVEASETPQFLQATGTWAASVALTCAALVAGGSLFFGSVEAAVAKLRGEPLSVTPHIDFGSGKPGEFPTRHVTVRNHTDTPVRLVGGTSDCACLTTQDMPLVIEAGQSATVEVRMKVTSATTGIATRQIEFLTDCPSVTLQPFELTGQKWTPESCKA